MTIDRLGVKDRNAQKKDANDATELVALGLLFLLHRLVVSHVLRTRLVQHLCVDREILRTRYSFAPAPLLARSERLSAHTQLVTFCFATTELALPSARLVPSPARARSHIYKDNLYGLLGVV